MVPGGFRSRNVKGGESNAGRDPPPPTRRTLLPFTVTRPVISQVMSIAVEFRDANRVFEKALSEKRLDPSIYVP
jgi:hypothetical protein